MRSTCDERQNRELQVAAHPIVFSFSLAIEYSTRTHTLSHKQCVNIFSIALAT